MRLLHTFLPHNLNPSILAVLFIVAGVLTHAGAARAQTTIYSDDFSGGAGLLNGTPEDAQGVLWSANSAFLANGNVALADEGSAVLPFSPVLGGTYELSVNVSNPSDRWFALGFAQNGPSSPGESASLDRYAEIGQVWMLTRDHATDPTSDVELFYGPGTANQLPDNDAAVNWNSPHLLSVVLSIAPDGSSFTADYRIDGSSVSGGAQTIPLSIESLNFVGMSYDNTATMPVSYDNFLLTEQFAGATPVKWVTNGGGNFNNAANWDLGTPTAGDTVFFGEVLSAANSPAVVTLNAPTSLNAVQFLNSGANYVIDGPSTLTLTGDARVTVASGSHIIAAPIGGTNGLAKDGLGTLVLAGNNSYSGLTDVQKGELRITNSASINGTVNVAAGASFFFEGDLQGGGFDGTFAPNITGAGRVELGSLLTTQTVTFDSAKSYSGQTRIANGTLRLTGTATPGTSDGTSATRTGVEGGSTNFGKVELAGGITVSNELLAVSGRQGDATEAPFLSNASGNNTWTGNIKGSLGGNQYNIESVSGLLTLSGNLSLPDSSDRILTFSGAGDITITGKLADFATDSNGNPIDANVDGIPDSEGANVNVIKRGSGTLTIATATGGPASINDYHRGTTLVEAGTLRVQGNGTTFGELLSSDITIKSGATMQIASFTTYNQQPGQIFRGSGTINTGGATLGLFGDGSLSPGDNVGTLTINGPVSLNRAEGGGTLHFDLGNTTSVGGTENDLIQINGSLATSGTAAMTVRVTPVEGTLAAGDYRLINHGAGGAAGVAGMGVEVVNQHGDVLNPRQTFSVTSSATASDGQVNLHVEGTSAARVWNGTVGNSTWDVDTSSNWSGGDSRFRDLDTVTFGAAGTKAITLDSTVTPGSTTFNGGAASTHTLRGSGGIAGYGPVNVNSGTVKLLNTDNDYLGTTTIANGARLEMQSASTGTMVVNGTLSVGQRHPVDQFLFASGTPTPYTPDANTLVLFHMDEANGVTAVSNSGTLTFQGVSTASETPTSIFAGASGYAGFGTAGTNQQTTGVALDTSGNGVFNYDNQTNPDTFNASTHLGDQFTLEAMINVASITGESGAHQHIWGLDGNSSRALQFRIDNTGVLNFDPIDGGGAAVTFDLKTITGDHAFAPNEWFHVAAIYDDGDVSLYWTRVDSGVQAANLVKTGETTVSFDTVDSPLVFGNEGRSTAGGTNEGLRGLLDEGRVSNVARGAEPFIAQTLVIDGDLVMGSNGALEFDLGNGSFDSISVTGSAVLDGLLAVNLLPGVSLSSGDSFTLLTAVEGITNSLDTFQLPDNFSYSIVDMTDLVLTYSPGLMGDFNGDGTVDAADYTVWRNNLGAAEGDLLAGNGDGGIIGASDYALWKSNFGETSMSGTASALASAATGVPEPSSLVLLGIVALGAGGVLRRRGTGQRSTV